MSGNILAQAKPKRTEYQLALLSWTRKRLASKSENTGSDMMDFVAASANKSKTISFAEAENSLSDFMLAGSETIATAVYSALYSLVKNSKVLRQLQDELAILTTRVPTHK